MLIESCIADILGRRDHLLSLNRTVRRAVDEWEMQSMLETAFLMGIQVLGRARIFWKLSKRSSYVSNAS